MATRPGFGPELQRFQKGNIGPSLTEIARDFHRRALAGFAAAGHPALQAAHTAVISHLGQEGVRITELARRAGMTKQGMGQLVDELERLGYVERVADSTDSRAKLVRFSSRGRRLIPQGIRIAGQVQDEYARLIGRRRMKALQESLQVLQHALRSTAPT
ncbi:MAG: hypothetical protein CMLOHMNK_01112 [Steroidobacteraceae bacterium]|nr:hypothetical protein [Steroidobacteraceae bacterium]